MKKMIIILVILLFNSFPNYDNNTGHIHFSNQIYSQQKITCPTTGSGTAGSGGGFWAWLYGLFTDIGTAITNVVNSIVDFFAANPGGEAYNNESSGGFGAWMSTDAGWTIEVGSGTGGVYAPGNDASTFTQTEWNLLNNLGGYYQQYVSSPSSNGGGNTLTPVYYVTMNDEQNKYYDGGAIYRPLTHDDNKPVYLYIHNDNGSMLDGPTPVSSTWFYDANNNQIPKADEYAGYLGVDARKETINIQSTTFDNLITVKLDMYGAPKCDSVPGTSLDGCGHCAVAGEECTYPLTPDISYTMTSDDQSIWNQMDQEDILTASSNNSNPCQGTNRTGNIRWPGVLQHWIIMIDWIRQDPVNHDVEFGIPGSSSKGNGNYGYADLVDKGSRQLYEIKPNNANGRNAGHLEIQTYVNRANVACPPATWTAGTSYTTRTLPSGNSKVAMVASLAEPGVVVYGYPAVTPVPSPAPSNIMDELKELVRKLRWSTTNIQSVITGYLRNHPELVTYLKGAALGAAVGIIVGTIAEDIATLGAGISDDWASFLLAYKIVRFAWAM